MLKDVDNFNFELCDNSPAFAKGFKKIDMADVGVRR